MPLIVGGTLALGSAAFNYFNSSASESKSRKQLDQLNKTPLPEYKVTGEQRGAYNMALQDMANPAGVSATEKAAFQGQIAQNSNTQYQNAINRAGGSMGKYIGGILNVNNTNAINQFAANDARIRSQNRNFAASRVGQGAAAIQNVSDRNTNAAIQRRLLVEQALGGAIAQQQQNQSNAISSLGNIGGMAAGYGIQGYMSNKYPGTYTPTSPYQTSGNMSPVNPEFRGYHDTSFGAPVNAGALNNFTNDSNWYPSFPGFMGSDISNTGFVPQHPNQRLS